MNKFVQHSYAEYVCNFKYKDGYTDERVFNCINMEMLMERVNSYIAKNKMDDKIVSWNVSSAIFKT